MHYILDVTSEKKLDGDLTDVSNTEQHTWVREGTSDWDFVTVELNSLEDLHDLRDEVGSELGFGTPIIEQLAEACPHEVAGEIEIINDYRA